MKIMETEAESVTSSESDGGSLELMQQVKDAVSGFGPVLDDMDKRIAAIKARSAVPPNLLTDAVRFRSAAAAAWFGAPAASCADFVRKVLEEGVVKTDLETRAIWLQPVVAEALGLPFGERVGLFDFLRGLPGWLEV